jgi:hypothetical protein
VARLLEATGWLMLPRHQTVLSTDDLSRWVGEERDKDGNRTRDDAGYQIRELLQTYFLRPRPHGGPIGFSSRLERWGPDQQWAAGETVAAWKRQARG